jgi:hypothetical protein
MCLCVRELAVTVRIELKDLCSIDEGKEVAGDQQRDEYLIIDGLN